MNNSFPRFGAISAILVGAVSLVFSRLIVHSRLLPGGLGNLGIFNALLLVILFFASAAGAQTLILISGGLTSVIVGPIWWIWLGRQPSCRLRRGA